MEAFELQTVLSNLNENFPTSNFTTSKFSGSLFFQLQFPTTRMPQIYDDHV